MENKNDNMLPVCLSIIFPGVGQFYQRKWLSGTISLLIHVITSFFLLRYFIKYVAYFTLMPDGEMGGSASAFIIFIAIIIINMAASIGLCLSKTH
ncbi:hypothetical protein [Paenibacillus sp. GCM10027626]|uniref:hypothetical protein n=1 Tax=Paenibacillus sp. GCM10027626 TaxID=3273411 RepID=UPI00363B6F46